MNLNFIKQQWKTSRALGELIIILSITFFMFLIISIFGSFEIIPTLFKHHDKWGIDEIITFIIFLIFAFGVFSIRRWKELKREINNRKKAEEALRQGEEKYRLLIENANDAIVVAQDGMLKFVNPKATQITGYSEKELTSMPFVDFIFQDDKEMVLNNHLKLLKRETLPIVYSFRIVVKDGNIKWVEISNVLITWEGRPATLNFLNDVTERIRTEEEKSSLQEQLRQSQKMEAIGQLAGGVAHDFNNLLTIIKGYSQLSLTDLKEDDPVRENIEEINNAAERASALTRQLLAFSRRQILEFEVLDLNFILQDLKKMLHRIIGENIELVTVLSDNLGKVKTDPGQIEQVILNLAVNARDAMPNGGKLTIETINMELDDKYAHNHFTVTPGQYVMLSVSDTGCGMTPEVRDRVFEPFFTTKEKGKGTGLGLSVVYGIVKQSGGYILVYSEPDHGTAFKIYFPRVEEPLSELKEKVVYQEIPRGNETILVVEDEEKVRNFAVEALERQGYKVLNARGGSEALYLSQKNGENIDLLFTDVVMPEISGTELANRLKSLHPEMKVIFMSGYTDDSIIRHGVLKKEMNFIQKPFTLEKLAREVRKVLDDDRRVNL